MEVLLKRVLLNYKTIADSLAVLSNIVIGWLYLKYEELPPVVGRYSDCTVGEYLLINLINYILQWLTNDYLLHVEIE